MPLPSDVAELADRPEARNLVGIFAGLTDTDHASVLRDHGGQGFGPFKTALTDLLVERLVPIAAATNEILSDQASLISLLRSGAERAAEIAEPIVAEAERLVGFVGLG
jgi:tryptophanyl-tRNA synthetase